MILHGEIVPRPDAAPDEYKLLGAIIRAWFARTMAELTAANTNPDGWIDAAALADLDAGELPRPALLRLVGGVPGLGLGEARAAVEQARASSPTARKVVPVPTARSVSFGVCASGDVRGQVLDTLRRALPAGAIADVLVDGERVVWPT